MYFLQGILCLIPVVVQMLLKYIYSFRLFCVQIALYRGTIALRGVEEMLCEDCDAGRCGRPLLEEEAFAQQGFYHLVKCDLEESLYILVSYGVV